MGTRASILLTQTLLVAAGVGLYHVVTARRDAAPTDPAPGTAPAAPQPTPSALPPLAASPGFVRFESLERRVASIERALSNAGALAPGMPPDAGMGGGAGVGTPPVSAVWTEGQLEAMRAMLAEIEMRKNQENYAATMREVIRRTAKEPIPEDQENRALALLVAFQRKVAEIFPGGSAGTTPEERAASNEAATRVRDALEEEIRRLLPAEVAERILSMVPRFPSQYPADNRAAGMGG